ncbi:hypothetical protein XNC1_0244 [Xenorhabdus nematophila ATCC 19061]|uniref:ATP-grasp domain-containing protein n=1 Tax=Xenorhabdus nematophila (strain ATCC 19061 / DSM 3370 / CCUG 14189 / LMG 1036 / NCIMB 9965 / AN6) TaxID=406817 RepID=D3VH47_XENNA|nr:hypothetical protein [Xenorhabdus nematophila]CBJ88332.1 hypothetical protein XNC1_0244 [Xenorhabdus nematophila ATCC 19061]CEK21249.1 hypothetical protein XNC2_0245 [Xenorhabdus nematophila AN6/1]
MNGNFAGGYSAPDFILARNDSELVSAMPQNMAAGYFRTDLMPEVFYHKCAQYTAIKTLAPELVFNGRSVNTLTELPRKVVKPMVIRPAFSPQSKGSALIVGGNDRPSMDDVIQQLRHYSGPFQLHDYEEGQPLFINGILSIGTLIISDMWRCITLPIGYRDILTAVINLSEKALPEGLPQQLAELAIGMGMLAGPLHIELVLTADGPKIVKLTPRLASSPLPDLCHFGGWQSQQQLWQTKSCNIQHKSLIGYVADYSFIFLQAGRVKQFFFEKEIKALSSFSYYFMSPKIGQDVQMTIDGDTYGCTLFLRNNSLEILESEIAYLTTLNLKGAFHIESIK